MGYSIQHIRQQRVQVVRWLGARHKATNGKGNDTSKGTGHNVTWYRYKKSCQQKVQRPRWQRLQFIRTRGYRPLGNMGTGHKSTKGKGHKATEHKS